MTNTTDTLDAARPMLPPEALQRARALIASGPRHLLGVVGPPGAGKSTVVSLLVAALGKDAVGVPMDGFHLAQAELTRLDRAQRKGAPDTFDSAGYVALLRRLRDPRPDETVYAAEFRRDIEEPIAGAIAVSPATRLVVTEGNYLLLNAPYWNDVPGLLDDVWYVDVDDAVRVTRLVARHERHGRSLDAARAWVAQTDEPNARRVEATRDRARFFLRWC